MTHLTLVQAEAAIDAALEKARELSLKPLTVAALDAGGHLIALKLQDGASNLRPQLAIGKAAGALALGVSSRAIGEMAAERPTFIAALGPLASQGLIPAAGGVIVVDRDGNVIGALGATGDTSDNDEACVLAGLLAAKLLAKP